MFEKKVKVDNKLWNKIKKDFQTEDDQVVLKKIFIIYLKSENAIEENNNLKRELSESIKTIKEKRTEMDTLSKEHRRTLIERNKLMKKNARLRKEVDSLRRSIRTLEEQKTSEKKEVVYIKDHNALNALNAHREKNKKQKHEIWKLRNELEDARSWKDKYKDLKSVVKNWKRENMAILVKGISTLNPQNIDIEIIDSKTYYLIKADPEGYRKKKRLNDILIKEISYYGGSPIGEFSPGGN